MAAWIPFISGSLVAMVCKVADGRLAVDFSTANHTFLQPLTDAGGGRQGVRGEVLPARHHSKPTAIPAAKVLGMLEKTASSGRRTREMETQLSLDGNVIEDAFDLDNPKAKRRYLLLLTLPPIIMLALVIMQTVRIPVAQFCSIKPRSLRGLLGLLLSPWAHWNLFHFLKNMISWFGLATGMATYGISVFALASVFISLVGGLLVWLLSPRPDSNHAGLSGVLFGYLAFLISEVIWVRPIDWIAVAVLLVTIFLYGSMVCAMFCQVLSLKSDVSWESHVFGFAAGVLFTWLYFAKFHTLAPESKTAISFQSGKGSNQLYKLFS
ncbi:unnamed protein product [Vitrella brassicaformis CCMP3155]|uniref:Peptidase S54 rhomboid domain-containing protein n=1 Tax=Vitrella brassicaformis (strain CCMP3155) TaxID=1169540 RepID=A0A0G4EDQ6_VITBC|nr:unnamed protein product [Vitrella brassicaformis CCMP3155]|eukprot:CEL93508.1 unnamed protein product [Vitrella brassicaformis CCMP3155]